MTIAELLVPEFDQEVAKTRKLLALVPDDKFDYAPHPKSMKLGRLASHLAEMPRWLTVTVTTEMLEPTPDMKGFSAAQCTGAGARTRDACRNGARAARQGDRR